MSLDDRLIFGEMSCNNPQTRDRVLIVRFTQDEIETLCDIFPAGSNPAEMVHTVIYKLLQIHKQEMEKKR